MIFQVRRLKLLKSFKSIGNDAAIFVKMRKFFKIIKFRQNFDRELSMWQLSMPPIVFQVALLELNKSQLSDALKVHATHTSTPSR